MAEEKRSQRIEDALSISPEEFQSLTPDMLRKLQQEHGLEISIRSTKPGIARIVEELGRPEIDIGRAAAYDRGFDRTAPGYDKYYDRDRNLSQIEDLVTQPGVDLEMLIQTLRQRGGK